MASIAAANTQRQNRWLLIGAASLALVAGILVALLLANSGSSTKTDNGTPGDFALVAKQTIPLNTKISAGMFDRVKVDTLVAGALVDESAAIGKIADTDILKGEQLSSLRLGTDSKSLGAKVPTDKVGYEIPVNETKSVGGLIVPGDHVDLIVTFRQKTTDGDQTRVETLFQNIQILAVGTDMVDGTASTDANGRPVPGSSAPRKDGAKPNPGATSVTLALTPQQVQTVQAALDRGEISLALRAPGDDTNHPVNPTALTDSGFGR